MKRYDVAVVGDANIDLVVTGCDQVPLPGQEISVAKISINVGGGGALCALGLAKLDLKTLFCGVLGTDCYGNFIMEQFKKYGLETAFIKKSKVSGTGISIAFSNKKDRSFITYPGSNAELDLYKINRDLLKMVRHLHVTGYKGRTNHHKLLNFINMARNLTDITISTDVGWDETGEWFEGVFELMAAVDIFFINEVEALHYSRCESIEASLNKLTQYGKNIIVKMGDKGAITKKDLEIVYEPAYRVKAVDTTGAGDSFNAGYIYAYLNNMDPRKCLLYGNACGALSVTNQGGNTAFPDITTLLNFMNKHKASIRL